jgi:hypothetical protein
MNAAICAAGIGSTWITVVTIHWLMDTTISAVGIRSTGITIIAVCRRRIIATRSRRRLNRWISFFDIFMPDCITAVIAYCNWFGIGYEAERQKPNYYEYNLHFRPS